MNVLPSPLPVYYDSRSAIRAKQTPNRPRAAACSAFLEPLALCPMLLAAKHGPALTMRKNRPSGSDSQRTESSAGRVAEDPPSSTASPQPRKLLDRVRWHLRVKRYSIRTEQAYVDWIRRFILFHKKRHPDQMGHVKASLTCRSQLRFGDVLGLCFAFACGRRALHQLHSQLTKAHIAT